MYPETVPFEIQRVAVDEIHTLYVEHYGNPHGVPFIFLHGGPGSSWSRHAMRLFDPAHYRILAFDQRGSWRSTPLGELKDNTTPHLIADIELLRELIGVDRWIVFGGSWGSTLAIAYAETHPDRCAALVVRGVTLFRPGFEQWDFRHARNLFPEAWQDLANFAPVEKRNDLYEFYRDAILSDDESFAMDAVQHWYAFSDILSNPLHIDPAFVEPDEPENVSLAGGRISMHYWENSAFISTDALFKNAHQLSEIPGAIVHGRHDYNCTIGDAYDLHLAWPQSKFTVIEDAGHAAMERGTWERLLAVMEDLTTLSV